MIETRGLTRHFTQKGGKGGGTVVEAVRGIDLRVDEGELVAFLGPNGAGKSTTLRMLTTLLQPTAGAATVAGCDITRDPAGVRRRIGYIGQGNGAGHTQRVQDELVVQGRIYGLSRSDATQRSDHLLGALGLEDLRGRLVSTLSGGQRRRLDIALGMVHQPELLFLDEPSTGLDPQNRANLQDEIKALRSASGTTIVLTTHYLDEADALADRVVVIDHGQVIADDTAARLKASLAGDRMVLTVADPADTSRVADALARASAGRGSTAQGLTVAGPTVSGNVHGGAELLPSLVVELHGAGVALAAAEVARPTLDDVFLALTGRSLREGAEGGPDEPPPTDPAQGPSPTAAPVAELEELRP